jgi:hypothetical protein
VEDIPKEFVGVRKFIQSAYDLDHDENPDYRKF